jgi:predicted small metal-binding protein
VEEASVVVERWFVLNKINACAAFGGPLPWSGYDAAAVEISHSIATARKRAQAEAVVPREAQMARMVVDCRDYPSEKNCTVAISADNKNELVDAAAQHAVAVHGHHDSPELREQLTEMIKSQ